MRIHASPGLLLINEALPPEYRDYSGEWDAKRVEETLDRIAKEKPEVFPEVLKKFYSLGKDIATTDQGVSVGIEDLQTPVEADQMRKEIQAKVNKILSDRRLSPEDRNHQIIATVAEYVRPLTDTTFKALKKNAFAEMARSKMKGNAGQVRRILAGDLLYVDHKGRIIPYLVSHSFAEGLRPAEYWAATYSARTGLVGTKVGTGQVGYLTKQLAQAAHRLVVEKEKPPESPFPVGVTVSTDDPEAEGYVLASPVGGYKKGTLLTAKDLAVLRQQGHKKILVRSPLVSHAPNGGVYAMDVGVTVGGRFPEIGEYVGLQSAAMLGEPVTQLQIGSKHGGGVVGNKGVGFDYLNQVLQVPKHAKGATIHAPRDGTVTKIEPSDIGGHDVYIGNEKVHVPEDRELVVKEGDRVEAGDTLSTGVPNPAAVVRYKGIGEGRRYLADILERFYAESGLPVRRKNVEMIVRGLVNHVRFKEPFGEYLPGDVVDYATLANQWNIRDGAEKYPVSAAVGKYLEVPVLHYTIGTRITPKVAKHLKEMGVEQVIAHKDPPPFEAVMIPAARQILYDKDWMTQFLGGYQHKQFLENIWRGSTSDLAGSSYVPKAVSGTLGAERKKVNSIRLR